MIFEYGQDFLPFKIKAVNVLKSISDGVNPEEVRREFRALETEWDSTRGMLIRKVYIDATIPMPDQRPFENWRANVLNGINVARDLAPHLEIKHYRDEFYFRLGGFFTGLGIMESVHIDQVNRYYSA